MWGRRMKKTEKNGYITYTQAWSLIARYQRFMLLYNKQHTFIFFLFSHLLHHHHLLLSSLCQIISLWLLLTLSWLHVCCFRVSFCPIILISRYGLVCSFSHTSICWENLSSFFSSHFYFYVLVWSSFVLVFAMHMNASMRL